tara:strand:+ start:2406 stop:3488 length:1083 start_codon:yes stop_codon:yes gene_type:complete
MAVTINEKIRFYKANDPYYYEVDNLPLIDLLENDKSLRDELNSIIYNNQSWATLYYVDSVAQSAVGDVNIIDISKDGDRLPNNVVDWVLSKNYITLDDVDENEDPFVPKKISQLQDVTVLRATVEEGDILTYDPTVLQSNNVDYGVFVNKPPQEIANIPRTVYLESRYFMIGQEKSLATGGSDGHYLFSTRTQELYNQNSLDSDHFYTFASNVNGYAKGMYFIRSFQDLGIPENAKKIFCKYGCNFVCGDTVQNADSHIKVNHAHSPYTHGQMEIVDKNPDSTNTTSAYHRWESVVMQSAEKTGSLFHNTTEDLIDFTVHYGNAIKHPEDPSKNLLVFHNSIIGHTKSCKIFLYVYGYET